MTGPRHSFVIPCYRDAQGVARQLAWFAGRSEEIEVIVVDDASPEDIEADEPGREPDPPTTIDIPQSTIEYWDANV